MMQLEASPRDRVRVIGALTGAALKTLFEMVKTTDVLLDLSQVRETDAEALQLLARLAPERCDRFASNDLSGRMAADHADIRLGNQFPSRGSFADSGAALPARGRP
jgi:hypothetical protein